jgi:hypothetical protein
MSFCVQIVQTDNDESKEKTTFFNANKQKICKLVKKIKIKIKNP